MLKTDIGKLREELGLGGDLDTIITDAHDITGLPTIKASELENGVYMPIKGDRTATGMLRQMQGLPLDRPVGLQGGPTYGMESQASRADPAAWESTETIAKSFQDKVQKVADKAGTDNVYGVYSPMSLNASDFSTMVTDSALEEMQTLIARGGKYPKKMVEQIDEAVRKSGTDKQDFSKFPGIESPAARDWLSRPGYQNARKALTNTMKAAPFREAGFPKVHQIMRDIAQPGLLNRGVGESGDMIVKLNPNGSVDNLSSHRSYGTRIPVGEGRQLSRLNGTLPHNEMYPQNYGMMRGQVNKAGEPLTESQKINTVADSKPGGARVDGYEAVTPGLLESLINRGLIAE